MHYKNLDTWYNVKHITSMILASHKQPKEPIHLALKIKNGASFVQFQLLIFFRMYGDPSVFFGPGIYLEDGCKFAKITHRDPEWDKAIETVLSAQPGWDKKQSALYGSIVSLGSINVIARPGDGEFYYIGGNLYPEEECKERKIPLKK